MQTTTATKTQSITKTKMLVATLALGAAAAAFLMAPVKQKTVSSTTGTVTYIETTEWAILSAIIVAGITAITN